MRRLGTSSIALALLVASCAPREPSRPNVLLISLDSVRRDMLGCYGARFAESSPSPSLDWLAQGGVRFEDAFSGTSWTLPAHATLFTGVPELVHGVEQDGQRLGDALPTLAEELHARGYRTAGVYSGPYLDPRFGLARGFERWHAGYGPELASAARAATEVRQRVHQLDGSIPSEEQYAVLNECADIEHELEIASHEDSSSSAVTDLVLQELAAAGDGPFFLFAHYFDPHYDYVPPPPYDRVFDPAYEGSADGRGFAARIAAPRSTQRDIEHLRALHAGELTWVDSEIQRVLAELERRALAANTLIVVVSDHGDEFLEHGNFGHRRSLYEEVVRIPMILRWPGGLPAGEVRSGPVSLADVAPTILALVAGEPGRAPLFSAAPERPILGRLIVSPTGSREDVRVLESFHQGRIKLLRERTLDPAVPERLRWTDLALHPDEHEAGWSADFGAPEARAALDAFREEHARLVRLRHAAPPTERTEVLLAVFTGLGYPGQESSVGALADAEIVSPPETGDSGDGR